VTSRLSLRARLLLAVAAVVVVAFALADFFVYRELATYLDNQVDATLEVSHHAVEATALNPLAAAQGGSVFVPGRDNAQPSGGDEAPAPVQVRTAPAAPPGGEAPEGRSAFCALGRESAPGLFIEVLNPNGTVVTGPAGREICPAFQPGSASYTPALPAGFAGLAAAGRPRTEPQAYLTVGAAGGSGPSFRVRASALPNGQVLVLAAPLSSVSSTLSQLVGVEVVVTGAAVVAAVVLGGWMVRVGLRPLRDVERTAEAISGGDLVHRVPNPNPRTEVGHMATAFNVMVSRVEELVEDLRSSEARLRRFVGDASHELRTPLAAVSAYAQLFERGAASHPEDVERAMAGVRTESARMARLVEDLLTLARLDEHAELALEPVELVDLVTEATGTARLVGPAWPVGFVAREAVEVMGDRGALRQVVDNLLANVRAHTPPGTRATVTVERRGSQAMIEVADNGPGITAEQAAVVFERFFRADPSRSRQTGGAGLGLSIVASIMQAHQGRAEAEPAPGGGAVFRVWLPALPPEET
jgi:two-component system OmpR family sensor kinase